MTGFTSIKFKSEFAELVREEAERSHRSISGQLEHWARLGKAVEESPFDRRQLTAVLDKEMGLPGFTDIDLLHLESILASTNAFGGSGGDEIYTHEKTVMYEVLRDLTNTLVASRSAAIAAEEEKAKPDAGVLDGLQKEILNLRSTLAVVMTHDIETMQRLIAMHQAEIREKDQGGV